jgi:hypothetical protein
MPERKTAFNHPFFLTIVILYSAAIGVAFATFPPLHWPLIFTDILMTAALVLFVSLITVSYAHGSASPGYEAKLFLLKALIATLFAWQFRLLDTVRSVVVDHKPAHGHWSATTYPTCLSS